MTAPRRVQILWVAPPSRDTQLITLDASVEEKHSFVTAVTDHPVEKGLNVSDHLRPEPIILQIEGVISNHPVFLLKDNSDGARETQVQVKGASPTIGSVFGRPVPIVGALVSGIPLPLPTPTGVVKGFDPEFDRVKNVLEQLLLIRTKGYLVSVVTTLKDYTQMAITSFDVPRNAALGNSLRFTMQLKEIRFGSSRDLPAPEIPTKKADKGVRPAIPDPPIEPDRTLLRVIGGND